MIEEIKEIAENFKWKYFVFEEEFPENSLGKISYDSNIYGICIIPPKCDPVSFSFLSNGRMSNEPVLKLSENQKRKNTRNFYAGFIQKHSLQG